VECGATRQLELITHDRVQVAYGPTASPGVECEQMNKMRAYLWKVMVVKRSTTRWAVESGLRPMLAARSMDRWTPPWHSWRPGRPTLVIARALSQNRVQFKHRAWR
jgi:hypothetical protein